MGEPSLGRHRSGEQRGWESRRGCGAGRWGANPTPPLHRSEQASVSASAKWNSRPYPRPQGGHKAQMEGRDSGCFLAGVGRGVPGVMRYYGPRSESWDGRDTHKAGILAALRVTSTNHVSPDVNAEIRH